MSAVAVFAVVGAALAFKARSTDFVYVHAATDPVAGRCTLKSFGFTTVDNGAQPVQLSASSTTIGSNCPLIDIYPAQ